MAGRRKTRWRGRYTNKADFLLRMERLINQQVENYERNPEEFRRFLPVKIHSLETERPPSALISQTLIYAECLIAIGRIPTPEYMWHLMAIEPEDAPPYIMENGMDVGWQAHLSDGLMTLEEHRQQKGRQPGDRR